MDSNGESVSDNSDHDFSPIFSVDDTLNAPDFTDQHGHFFGECMLKILSKQLYILFIIYF